MTRLTVAVRVRPLSDKESSTKSVSIVSVENGRTIAVTNMKVPEQNAGDSRERVRRFTFDCCFDSQSTQDDVYQSIGKEVAKAIKKRFHSCILAYGQSSSGKTHTMIGVDEDVGLAPRLCENIFNYLSETAVGEESETLKATVSYLEIYNEKVRDLLQPELSCELSGSLKVREHPKKGPYVPGLSEQSVIDAAGLLNCLQTGNANRTVGATNANPKSSRSHSVFTVTCCDGLKLRLVDLAGSERAGARSHTTSRFREGANINKSLVALRNVISALADGSKCVKSRKRFIPYRDSVLTWLLKDTLGGNSKTILISTVSPSSTCYTETVNTLRFGQRAKQIITQPLVNEDPKEKTIRELRAEIAKLRDLLLLAKVPEDCLPENKGLQEEGFTEWEKVEEFSSDSGLSLSVSSEDDENDISEDSCVTQVTTNLQVCEQNSDCAVSGKPVNILITDKLIPIMEVVSENVTKPKASLRRTFSMDHKIDNKPYKSFGSQEVLGSTSAADAVRKNTASVLRKRSMDKSTPSLRNLVKKIEKPVAKSEKSVVTESKGAVLKSETKSKVDSHRKPTIKPRSQIVAAVTHRLYNKVKKKEASTDTEDINKPVGEVPKELSICSNARSRLQELTKRALRAHRRKTVQTQTDLFPVLRVKEISTDVDDLKISLDEVKNVEISTDKITTNDIGINCSFLDTLNSETSMDYKNGLIITRTCGTSTESLNYIPTISEQKPPNLLSFTKYLQLKQEPKLEILNPATANPIYTSSVNINVNHNYINSNTPADNISDDSLEDNAQPNVCFPTPDLISNHNSLEQHAHELPSTSNIIDRKFRKDTRYAATHIIPENFQINNEFQTENINVCSARCEIIPRPTETLDSIEIESVFAPQTCIEENIIDDYNLFYVPPPNFCKANVITDFLEGPAQSSEAIILKSIMRLDSAESHNSSEEESDHFENVPDSLNYYYEKKKVRFNEPQREDKMYEVMSNFMKEVTTLMTNLTKVTTKLEDFAPSEQNYDCQLTINDIQGLPRAKRKVHHKREKHHRRCSSRESSTVSESTTQTSPIRLNEMSTGMNDNISVNRYESVVVNSCDRLEKLLETAENRKKSRTCEELHNLHKFPQPFSITNDWNYRNNPIEDSSLESTPTFSDYGSLPRRKYRRDYSSCSPSGYLKQLTSMRKQIVESSREELFNEAHAHL